MKHVLNALWIAPLLALSPLPAAAAETAGTLIDFHVDAQKSVANDLGRATAYAEIAGADPAEVARKVKAAIADALAAAKAQPGVVVRSGATHTTPVYAKGGRNIESWRMRSELLLESRDPAALAAALGRLQGTLAIGGLGFSPAPETQRVAEDAATLEAIDAFRAKAGRIADTFRKSYRIRQINVASGGRDFPRPQPFYRAAALAAEAAPMPVEAGESTVTVNVSGQIELID